MSINISNLYYYVINDSKITFIFRCTYKVNNLLILTFHLLINI